MNVTTSTETSKLDSITTGVLVRAYSPYIGENGNWFEYSDGSFVDTGIHAKGDKGDTGKTAYEYAKEKGYHGSEEDFALFAERIPMYATNAALSAEAADLSAKDAERSKDSASQFAQFAQTKSTEASGYADDASDAKDDAVTAKNDAVTAKNAAVSAKESAVTAKDDAVTAKNTAVAAKDTAVSAKDTAVSAKGSAETAAGTATTKASEASTSAATATTKASEASASATAADTSATSAATSAASATTTYNKIQQELPTINSKISALETTMPTKADKTALAKTDRSLKALWELNEGQTYQFETDDDAGDKVVPTGAKLCSALSIGGMSRKGYQLIPSTFAWCTEPTSTTRYTVNGNSVTNEVGDQRSWPNIISADRITLSSGTYTIHGDGNIRFQIGGTSQIASSVVNTLTFTLTEQTDIGIKMLAQNNTYPVTGTNIILEKGTLPHDYEPYTDELIDAPVDKINLYLAPNFVNGQISSTGVMDYSPNAVRTGALSCNGGDLVRVSLDDKRDYSAVNFFNGDAFISKKAVRAEDDYKNFSVTAPANANRWYVETRKSSAILNVADVKMLLSVNDQHISIPESVTSLDGWGCGISAECANEWDVENGKFTTKVGVVDLGTLEWYWVGGDYSRFIAIYDDLATGTGTGIDNVLSERYESSNTGSIYSHVGDKLIAMHKTSSQFWVRDSAYDGDATALKSSLNGVLAYYEKKTPTETSVTDEIEPFTVEAGGTIAYNYTDKSTYPIDVPNTVEYTVKLSEVAE